MISIDDPAVDAAVAGLSGRSLGYTDRPEVLGPGDRALCFGDVCLNHGEVSPRCVGGSRSWP